eukprot:5874-Heterococcus_DN1.PRE.1
MIQRARGARLSLYMRVSSTCYAVFLLPVISADSDFVNSVHCLVGLQDCYCYFAHMQSQASVPLHQHH